MRTLRRSYIFVMAALLLAGLAEGGGAHLGMDIISGPGGGPRLPGMAFCQIDGVPHCTGGDPDLISIVRSERGVALRTDGERIPVRLLVEKAKGIDPSLVRRLLEENRTLGEIRAEIEGYERAYSYRGNLRLGGACYLLGDLEIVIDGQNSTLEGDLLEPAWGEVRAPPSPARKRVGKIAIDTRLQNGSYISVGSLVIRSGPLAGSYVVVMDPLVGGGRGPHASAVWIADMIPLEERSEDPGAHMNPDRTPHPGWGWRGREVTIWGAISSRTGDLPISPSVGPGRGIGPPPFDPHLDDETVRELRCRGLGQVGSIEAGSDFEEGPDDLFADAPLP